MNQKVPDLDLATLEYVHKILMKDWGDYLREREDAVTEKGASIAMHKFRAISKVDNEIMALIWKIGDSQQQEAEA